MRAPGDAAFPLRTSQCAGSAQTGQRAAPARVLIYSHDSYGLGHLRRCRAIAHALAETRPDLSVLILSGSPIIGSFEFRPQVDFVRIPGVVKLPDGDYTAHNLQIGIEDILDMRASLIRHTAEVFQPDLFIVDKEPLGLRGEVEPTLNMLKRHGVPLVLGLRDVMDEPALLRPEWERKHVLPALEELYDELWVYGLPQICDPLAGIAIPPSVRRKMIYTGYLRREIPAATLPGGHAPPDAPFILVTTGGGGDGEAVVDWVLRAYEHDAELPYRAVIVMGPFMDGGLQAQFIDRAARLPMVEISAFEPRLESLMAAAQGVVAMGGYNTFCEILSFDKRALIIPREAPRREQFIRAARAQEMGLAAMLTDDGLRCPVAMATALRQLPQQAPPSAVVAPGLLDGLVNVNRLAARRLAGVAAAPGVTRLARGLRA